MLQTDILYQIILVGFNLEIFNDRKLYGDNASYFDMEMKPRIKHTKKGLVSYVNNGNHQHGSQVGFHLKLKDVNAQVMMIKFF